MLNILKFEGQVEDIRGKIMFFSYGDKKINMSDIKKGFARGGHYYDSEQIRIIISGKIEYRTKNIVTGEEQIMMMDAPRSIVLEPKTAHIFTALEDTVLIELFDNREGRTNYPEYRTMVENKMKNF